MVTRLKADTVGAGSIYGIKNRSELTIYRKTDIFLRDLLVFS